MGFRKHATTLRPVWCADTASGSSPVNTIVGICTPLERRSCCSSTPVIVGMWASMSRQSACGQPWSSEARNSWPEAYTLTPRSNTSQSRRSPTRTPASSSTITTRIWRRPVWSLLNVAPRRAGCSLVRRSPPPTVQQLARHNGLSLPRPGCSRPTTVLRVRQQSFVKSTGQDQARQTLW